MCGFISGSSILFHWSTCLSLYQYHAGLSQLLCSTAWGQAWWFHPMFFFTILTLLIHEHGRSFSLLRYSSISFFRDLKFLSNRSFSCFVRVTPRYFISFVTTAKGWNFPNFFLSLFILWVEKGYWIVWVNFISSHFAEIVSNLSWGPQWRNEKKNKRSWRFLQDHRKNNVGN